MVIVISSAAKTQVEEKSKKRKDKEILLLDNLGMLTSGLILFSIIQSIYAVKRINKPLPNH